MSPGARRWLAGSVILGCLALSGWLSWAHDRHEQQLAALGCPAHCCGGRPTCTSYYYSPAFRADTDDVYLRAVAALQPKPGERIADVGAGWGAVTLRVAPLVGASGYVVATDLDATRLAEISRRARESGWSQVATVAVRDPWSTGLDAGTAPLSGLVFLNSVNFKREDERDKIVAYLKAWRALLAPGARVVYHTDWIDKWLYTQREVREVFQAAGFGQAESLPLPPGIAGQTCYCPAQGDAQVVDAGYLLRWTVGP